MLRNQQSGNSLQYPNNGLAACDIPARGRTPSLGPSLSRLALKKLFVANGNEVLALRRFIGRAYPFAPLGDAAVFTPELES